MFLKINFGERAIARVASLGYAGLLMIPLLPHFYSMTDI